MGDTKRRDYPHAEVALASALFPRADLTHPLVARSKNRLLKTTLGQPFFVGHKLQFLIEKAVFSAFNEATGNSVNKSFSRLIGLRAMNEAELLNTLQILTL